MPTGLKLIITLFKNQLRKTQKREKQKMVNLLSNKSLRCLTILLSIFGIGACVSHCFVFIILFSRIETFARLWKMEVAMGEEQSPLPLSILGQGLWCGGMALCTACVTFSYISARIQVKKKEFSKIHAIFFKKKIFFNPCG